MALFMFSPHVPHGISITEFYEYPNIAQARREAKKLADNNDKIVHVYRVTAADVVIPKSFKHPLKGDRDAATEAATQTGD